MSIITDYIIAKFSLEVSISTIPGLKISVSKIKEVWPSLLLMTSTGTCSVQVLLMSASSRM